MRTARLALRTTARLGCIALLAAALPSGAAAGARVVADIAPVHALAARVMEGAGTPSLLLPPDASPHGAALKPSDARALAAADLVVMVGPALTPALAERVAALAPDARHLVLLDLPGVRRIATDGEAEHGQEEHGHEEHGQEEHGQEEHGQEEHAHDEHGHEEHGHDEHGQEEHGEHADGHADGHAHGHAHGPVDPHAWLDPGNAILWTRAIAAALAEADPAQAALYRANADAAVAELEALRAEIAATIEPVAGKPYVVFHDAYRYFETAFGIGPVASLLTPEAEAASAARLAATRDRIAETGALCIFAEPQHDPGLIAAVAEGSELGTGILDPLGADIAPGPESYGRMMRGLASALSECLSGREG